MLVLVKNTPSKHRLGLQLILFDLGDLLALLTLLISLLPMPYEAKNEGHNLACDRNICSQKEEKEVIQGVASVVLIYPVHEVRAYYLDTIEDCPERQWHSQ